jgi:HK97 family phage major capsid protein
MGSLGIRVLTGLSGNINIPRKTVASSIGNVTEVQAATETHPTTAKLSLTPRRKSAFVEYSKQAILQSGISIESMLRDDLLQSLAVTIENEAISGSGTAPAMRGIRNTSGVGSVVGGTNGANFAWTHVIGLESAVANANAEPDGTAGYLINTKTRGTAKGTQKATNLQFLWDGGPQPLNDYRVAVTNNVPSNLTKGSSNGVCSSVIFSSMWDMAVLALFDSPEITIDPYTLATTGQVRITINQYADFGIRQPAAFAVMDDALTP